MGYFYYNFHIHNFYNVLGPPFFLIPVKIVFDSNTEHAQMMNALRVGMSADVTINTLDGSR